MSTNPITVQIAGDDAQLNNILARALANIKAFGNEAGNSGEKMSRSFGEAKGAAALLGEEVGIKLDRHLRGILATSELLGPALELAFPIVAAIGFIDVAKEVFDKISGVKALEKDLAASEAWQKHAEEVSKQYEEIKRQVVLIGQSEAANQAQRQVWAAQDAAALQQFKQQLQGEIDLLDKRDAVRQVRDTTDIAHGGGGLVDVGGLNAEEIEKRKKLVEQVHDIDLQLSLKKVEIVKDGAEAEQASYKSLLEQLKDVNAEVNKEWETWQKLNDEIDKSVKALDETAFSDLGKRFESQRKQLAPWIDPKIGLPSGAPLRNDQSELLKIQQDQNEAWAKAREVLDQIEQPAEKYRVVIEELKVFLDQGRISQFQFNEAMIQAKQKFSESYQAAQDLGKAFGDALKEGALMGRSWNDVMKSLLVTIAELIIKFTLLKALQNSSFGTSGFGGFLTAIVGGLAGKAGGGPISAGVPYMVGENGPEPFMPNTSGSIVPNGKWGGGQVVYNIDARGADMGVEQKIITAMQIAENRAVARSVAITRENGLRGRG